ncbi:hypothetical protein AK812_SmicGene40496 [Symbiodinium microadriaticum]|uniref:Uncharacterized protein n=1 Tax=Symbiodinium microadriaticum TaxID=2951 RepID=A0A1Q9C8J7_SYMMI|nr:hypothetical protein AK812_SmicGene40496 [Symbiodinium microadriaticum]
MALTSLLASLLAWPLSKMSAYTGKGFVLGLGSLALAVIPLAVVLGQPDAEANSFWGPWLLALYALQGLGRSVYEGANRAIFADMFSEAESSGAFANCMMQPLGHRNEHNITTSIDKHNQDEQVGWTVEAGTRNIENRRSGLAFFTSFLLQVFLPGSACDTVVAVIVVGSSSMALPGYFVVKKGEDRTLNILWGLSGLGRSATDPKQPGAASSGVVPGQSTVRGGQGAGRFDVDSASGGPSFGGPDFAAWGLCHGDPSPGERQAPHWTSRSGEGKCAQGTGCWQRMETQGEVQQPEQGELAREAVCPGSGSWPMPCLMVRGRQMWSVAPLKGALVVSPRVCEPLVPGPLLTLQQANADNDRREWDLTGIFAKTSRRRQWKLQAVQGSLAEQEQGPQI